MQKMIDDLTEMFKGHHFEILLYPSGGILDVEACDECGTQKSYSQSWKYKHPSINSIDAAVNKIKEEMKHG